MSLYTFATDSLTTFADLRRRPAVDVGQVVRTLALIIAFAIALATAAPRGDVSDDQTAGGPAGSSTFQQ